MTDQNKLRNYKISYSLIDNQFSDRKVEDAIKDLFSEDGVVYLVAGYFSISGYNTIKKSMKDFLDRNTNNKIILIVGTEPNQFSATIAYDLWKISEGKQIDILKFSEKFLHTKHYVRDNENPSIILGSANFTRGGLREHLELVSFYKTDNNKDSIAKQHIDWFRELVKNCEPITDEDLEEYERKRIKIDKIEETELLEKLGLSIKEIEEKLFNPDPFPKYYLNLLSNYLEIEDTSKNTLAIKSRIKKYPHQIVGAAQAYKNLSYHGFYLLADEVGLGKTFEAGLALKQLKFTNKVKRALIICNASAMRDWEGALKKFYENPTIITSSKKLDWQQSGFSERDIWLKDDIMICTHQMFRQAVEKGITNDKDWDIILLDEAHVVKNHLSQTYDVVKKFNVKYKIFLTATPVQNREREFYNLFNAMKEGFLGASYKSYKNSGEKGLRDLLQGEKESFLTRFLRNELPYMEIPPRKVSDRFVTLSKKEHEVYSLFIDFLKDLVDKNKESAAHFISVVYQKIAASSWFSLEGSLKKLREKHEGIGTKEIKLTDFEKSFDEEGQTSIIDDEKTLEVDIDLLNQLIDELESLNGESKLNEIVKALSDILKQEDRVLVFTQYKRNIVPKSQLKEKISGKNLLLALQESDKINCPIYTYHGGMNTTERYEVRKSFEKNGGIFLATEAGAESINLQHCNVMVNFDIPWNPARIEQRIGRIQRLGQKKEVAIFNLVLGGTLDESVYEKVVKKHGLLQQKFGSSESVTQQEALEAVESGTIDEINSTSKIFLESLQKRKGPEEIKKYFEKSLEKRDKDLNKLRKNMEKSLEDFDDRIKILLTGGSKDTSKIDKEIRRLSSEYKNLLIDYLTYLRFTSNILSEFKKNEVLLQGNERLLGDNKIHVALDSETSLFKDIPLLTPKNSPLSNLLNETKVGFSITKLQNDGNSVFDFLVEINSPVNIIQRVIRIKTNGLIEEAPREFPKERKKSDSKKIDFETFISDLKKAYPIVKKKSEKILKKEIKELDGFITSEVSRLRKKEAEEIRERIKKEVKDPIKLQKAKVDSIKEKMKKGKSTGKEFESAKRELQKRQNNRKKKEIQIRERIGEKYEKEIKKVRRKLDECDYKISLISTCIG